MWRDCTRACDDRTWVNVQINRVLKRYVRINKIYLSQNYTPKSPVLSGQMGWKWVRMICPVQSTNPFSIYFVLPYPNSSRFGMHQQSDELYCAFYINFSENRQRTEKNGQLCTLRKMLNSWILKDHSQSSVLLLNTRPMKAIPNALHSGSLEVDPFRLTLICS